MTRAKTPKQKKTVPKSSRTQGNAPYGRLSTPRQQPRVIQLHQRKTTVIRIPLNDTDKYEIAVGNIAKAMSETGINTLSYVVRRIDIYPTDTLVPGTGNSTTSFTFEPTQESWAFQGVPGAHTRAFSYLPSVPFNGPYNSSMAGQNLVTGTNAALAEFTVAYVSSPPIKPFSFTSFTELNIDS